MVDKEPRGDQQRGREPDHESNYRRHELPDYVRVAPDNGPDGRHYLYVDREVVVVDEDVDIIRDRLEAERLIEQPSRRKLGITRFRLAERTDGEPYPDDYVPELVARLRRPIETRDHRTLVPGVFPHLVIALQWHGEVGPGEPPQPAGPLHPLPRRRLLPLAGRGVTVAVIDTGLSPGDPAWFAGRATGDPDTLVDAAGNMDWAAGHGTHIASTILRYAPGARVVVYALQVGEGVFTDEDLAAAIDRLVGTRIDILSFSGGGPTHERTGLPATERAIARLLQAQPHVAVIAAAGNDRWDNPNYPAALKSVYGVGAITLAGDRAAFSNFGSWVDCCAVGVRVHAKFIKAAPPFDTEPFCATWSGTSFATPTVAAAVAARHSPAGWLGLLLRLLRPLLGPKTPREAADRLIHDARAERRPGLGTVVRPRAYA